MEWIRKIHLANETEKSRKEKTKTRGGGEEAAHTVASQRHVHFCKTRISRICHIVRPALVFFFRLGREYIYMIVLACDPEADDWGHRKGKKKEELTV